MDTNTNKELHRYIKSGQWREAVNVLLAATGTVYTSLHTHCLDLFDSDNQPEALCKRASELGAAGLAITQHGVASAIEPMRKACAARGLKLVPGIEAYYRMPDENDRNAHLILLAKNDAGWGAISEAISESQSKDGFAIMSDETLNAHFGPGSKGYGNVYATSACIQGPLGLKLRHNQTIRHEIEKIERRTKNAVSPDDGRLVNGRAKVEELKEQLREAIVSRDQLRKTSEAKFAAREKSLARLIAKKDPSAEEQKRHLEADKQKAMEAKPKFEEAKKRVERLRKQISAIERELRELETGVGVYKTAQAKIDALKTGIVSDEALVEMAREEALRLSGLFGRRNFLIELQYHGFEEEGWIYPILARIAKEESIACVASNDVHMIDNSEDEILHRQILRSMRFQTEWNAAEDGDREMYLKTDAQLTEWLLKILDEETVAKAMFNTRLIFDSCCVDFKHDNHYPVFPIKDGRTAEEVFDEEIERGIKWRFPKGFPDERYAGRIAYESGIIKSMGYVHYHLVVKDFLEYGRVLAPVPEEELPNAPLTIEEAKAWVKENGWRAGVSIGPGRGSAVGSLVCYVLGITSLDPIENGLLFERFLNPERVSMPDIDSDLSNRVRPYAIRYVTHKYGQDAVCGIMTMTIQAPKGSIRIAAKYYDLYLGGDGKRFLPLADVLAKKVPSDPGTKFGSRVESPELADTDKERISVVGAEPGTLLYSLAAKCLEMQKDLDHALMILKWARIIEGSYTSCSAHAAGIVISDGNPIKESLPLRWNEKLQEFTTQMDMVCVEEHGFLKMDFLGLQTLDIETDALRAIEERYGRVIDLLQVPLDDQKVYAEIFRTGRTNSVFQFASSGMKSMLKQFGPTCFEDLVILVSMFRPGPMQYLDDVIKVKNGKKEMTFLTPELKPILGKTYGAIVYQEQVMEIFQKLAGYSLGGADQVRRFMSKKKHDKLAHEREAFINGDPERGIAGCVANGISREAANTLFDQMTDFASYAFNKSHAAAYALTSYHTAFLKLYYPAEFLMAAMNWAKHEEYAGLIGEAKSFHVAVKAPDINKSGKFFTVDDDGAIRFGLSSIKDVGQAADDLLKERAENGAFQSFRDVLERTMIKKDALEAMVKAGCFDCFHRNRKALLAVCEPARAALKARQSAELKLSATEELVSQEQEELTEALAAGDNSLAKKISAAMAKSARQIKDQEKKLDEAEAAYEAALSIPSGVREDAELRMKAEYEALGAFVTASPLDEYPDPEHVGAVPIGNTPDRGDTVLMGVATNLQLKHKKADGKPMLFLTLEDRTGSIDVQIFTEAYASFGEGIEEGKVYTMRGRIEMDEDTKKFRPASLSVPNRRIRPYIMTVPSFALWHAKEASGFKAKYEDAKGAALYVSDQATGNMRELTYRVNGAVEELANVTRK